jgi:hypothetical protein
VAHGLVTFALVLGKAAWEAISGHVVFEFLYFHMVGDPITISHAGGVPGELEAPEVARVGATLNWRLKVLLKRGSCVSFQVSSSRCGPPSASQSNALACGPKPAFNLRQSQRSHSAHLPAMEKLSFDLGRIGSVALGLALSIWLAGSALGEIPAARPEAANPKPATAETGIASYYGAKYHGRPTASGEIYNMHELTAAHPRLAFGTSPASGQ